MGERGKLEDIWKYCDTIRQNSSKFQKGTERLYRSIAMWTEDWRIKGSCRTTCGLETNIVRVRIVSIGSLSTVYNEFEWLWSSGNAITARCCPYCLDCREVVMCTRRWQSVCALVLFVMIQWMSPMWTVDRRNATDLISCSVVPVVVYYNYLFELTTFIWTSCFKRSFLCLQHGSLVLW
jgi:hypothetical protein